MTPREADRLIKAGSTVTVHNSHTNEIFAAAFVRRDRRIIYTAAGGAFHRADLDVIEERAAITPTDAERLLANLGRQVSYAAAHALMHGSR